MTTLKILRHNSKIDRAKFYECPSNSISFDKCNKGSCTLNARLEVSGKVFGGGGKITYMLSANANILSVSAPPDPPPPRLLVAR